MAGKQPNPRPSQKHSRGGRRALDTAWLTHLASGGNPGDGMSLVENPQFIAGIALLNDCAYFEAHERFEDAWLTTLYPERLLCLGLSKLGAALEQRTRGNLRGARRILNDVKRCLDPLPEAYGSIDIQTLRNKLHEWRTMSGDAPQIRRISANWNKD